MYFHSTLNALTYNRSSFSLASLTGRLPSIANKRVPTLKNSLRIQHFSFRKRNTLSL